jgi:hypothetical protein
VREELTVFEKKKLRSPEYSEDGMRLSGTGDMVGCELVEFTREYLVLEVW